MAGLLTCALATLVCWCVFAGRLERAGLTAPIVFVTAGFVVVDLFGVGDLAGDPGLVKLIAEVTLVLVLFADASKVRLPQFRHDLRTFARLLGVGLPLTVALGAGLAALLLGLDPWAALLLGAALAPTDAALGAPIMANPTVPAHLRRALNVESGLNDGIVTPVVLLAVAGVATTAGIAGVEGPGHALLSLLVGAVTGVVVGGAGGVLTKWAHRRGWLSDELAGPAVLALALLAYSAALLVQGNGFVAAFVAGLVFGGTGGRDAPREVSFVDETGALASMVSWFVFGALAVPVIGHWVSWRVIVYAVLSLTLVRMVPVALALIGTKDFDRFSRLFVGWFGPRGLASVIFALIALEELHHAGDEVVAVIALTVLLSVVAHGVSAKPLAGMFVEPKAPGARNRRPA